MVAKAEDLVINLKSSDPGTRLKAVREVKNQVIGNKQRKKAFIKLGAIPHIVQVLKDEPESSLLVQCATVVGSLARVDSQCVQDVAHSGAVAPLFQMIASTEECVVDAGLRALNFIFEADGKKAIHTLEQVDVDVLNPAVSLLRSKNRIIATNAAWLVSSCACNKKLARHLVDCGAVDDLIQLVDPSSADALFCNAVKALKALLEGGHIAAELVQLKEQFLDTLLSEIKGHPDAIIRMQCASCLVALIKRFPEQDAECIRRSCLVACVRELATEDFEVATHHAAHLLVKLMDSDAAMVAAAQDGGVLDHLAMISRKQLPLSAMIDVLDAISLLIKDSENARRQLVYADWEDVVNTQTFVETVVAFMRSGTMTLQASACKCLRCLSRSVSLLRQLQSSFKQAAKVALDLVAEGQHQELQVSACALLSNLVLNFSPARETALAGGIIQRLGQLLASDTDPDMVECSMYAMANLMRQAKFEEKRAVMASLAGDRLQDLILNHPSCDVQVRALVFLQNLIADCTEPQTHEVLHWIRRFETGTGLDSQWLAQPRKDANTHTQCVLRAASLKALSNIAATGGSAIRQWIMKSGIVELLPHALQNSCPKVVVGGLWIIHNLCKGNEPDAAERIAQLRERNILEAVERLRENQEAQDVRERVAQVLALFSPSYPAPMQED